MKTDPAVVMSLNGSSGQDRSSSSITSNESLPPSVVHVSRDELRKFLKCKRVGNYLLGKTIGEGSFAKVKQGFHVLTGEKVAVKIIDKKQAMEDRYVSKNMRREAKILQMVRHPNVIQLLEVVETENRYYLVFEIAGGGDLMDYICYRKKLGEIEVRKFIRQIISAVNYLHQGGIIHRDLKVENLLLDDNYNIKIIDFGLSNTINVPRTGERSSTRDFCKTQCGSPAYAAPEILGHLTYGTKVDVWSIGVNMYAMLTGKLPYTADPFNIITLYNKMVKGDMNPIPDRLSAGCKDLMLRFLTFDPKERITIEEAIQHPWLRKGFEDAPLIPLDFPCYLRADELNSDIVNHMCDKMQFKTKDIIEGVTSNKSNAASCVYHLVNRKLKRYMDKHPTTRMLRRAKSRDDEIDAVPKKQRIDDNDSSDRLTERSRRGSLQTSRDLRLGPGAGSSQGSRGIRIGASASQGSRGPRGRLASDKDGTELKGSTIIPNASDYHLSVPGDDSVHKSGSFNQFSFDIEDDEFIEDDFNRRDIEGHDLANRKISVTYDFSVERKLSRPDYHPSPLAKDHKAAVLVFDDISNDNNNNYQDVNGQENTMSTKDDPTKKDSDVTDEKTTAMDAGMEVTENNNVIDGRNTAKDSGMAPVMESMVTKVVSVLPSAQLESLMGPGNEATLDPNRKSSLPISLQRERTESLTDHDMSPPGTRSRSGSLPSRTYPVTRDPSPIRKPRQPNQPLMSERNDSNSTAPTFGLVCQITSVENKEEPGKEGSDSAQLMLRSTLSPLSVHCSPKPSRRYSTPVNPKEFYKDVLSFNENASPRGSPDNKAHYEEKTQSVQDLRGTRSPSKSFGSPMVSRRFSASSTSSDDSKRALTPKKVQLPVTPREPLLPNLGLKLMMKHPAIEPLNLPSAPLSPRKFSLDSKTRRSKENSKEQRSRRRNTIMELPRRQNHDANDNYTVSRDLKDTTQSRDRKESRDHNQKPSNDSPRADKDIALTQELLEIPRHESRYSDSSNSSQDPHSGNVRARVTIKERRQTTDLDVIKYEVSCNNRRYSDTMEPRIENSLKGQRDKNDELRDKRFDSRDNHASRDAAIFHSHKVSTIQNRKTGNVKARVTIKERRQTSELDIRNARHIKRIQFQITDTHDVNGHVTRQESRVNELKKHERRCSVPVMMTSGPGQGVRKREEIVLASGPLVRRSSVPVLASQVKHRDSNDNDDTTKGERSKEKLTNRGVESLKGKETTLKERTRSEGDVKEITRKLHGNNPQNGFGNPWEKHERTIQRSNAMRAETGKKKAAERIRRHTVGSAVVNTKGNEQNVRCSPRILKKSLV